MGHAISLAPLRCIVALASQSRDFQALAHVSPLDLAEALECRSCQILGQTCRRLPHPSALAHGVLAYSDMVIEAKGERNEP